MLRSISVFLILFFWATAVYAQDAVVSDRQTTNQLSKNTPSIYKLTAKQGVVYKLQTAVGYVTTIELPDEALKVFVGDQDSFVVEVYGNEVIIKPATDYMDAKSNLTIYTEKTRLSFDVSVGSPETADFVLDFRYPSDEAMVGNAFKKAVDDKKAELSADYEAKIMKNDKQVKMLTQEKFEEAIKNGAKIKRLKISKRRGSVQMNLMSLAEIGGRYYLRFNVMNYSQSDFFVERIVLGKEAFRRSGFGLTKDGFIPVDFSQNVEKSVPKGTDRYGLISFDKIILSQNEKLVLRLYEKDKADPIEISEVPLEG